MNRINGNNVRFVEPSDFDRIASEYALGGKPFTVKDVRGSRILYPDNVEFATVVEVNELARAPVGVETSVRGENIRDEIRVILENKVRLGGELIYHRPELGRAKRGIRRVLMGTLRRESIVGKVLDFAEPFLPAWMGETRSHVKSYLKTDTVMPINRIKPWIKQKSTWEGVAAAAGAIGLVIYPEAIVTIVVGVLGVIAGIEMWKKEAEGQ